MGGRCGPTDDGFLCLSAILKELMQSKVAGGHFDV